MATKIPFDTTKDYFDILGVTEDTSATNIRSAFRHLALSTHPDHLPPDASSKHRSECNAKMQELTEARDVLLDEQKRGIWLMERARLANHKSNINRTRDMNQSFDDNQDGSEGPNSPKRKRNYDNGDDNHEYFNDHSSHSQAQPDLGSSTPPGDWRKHYWTWRRQWEAACEASSSETTNSKRHKRRCHLDVYDRDYPYSDGFSKQTPTTGAAQYGNIDAGLSRYDWNKMLSTRRHSVSKSQNSCQSFESDDYSSQYRSLSEHARNYCPDRALDPNFHQTNIHFCSDFQNNLVHRGSEGATSNSSFLPAQDSGSNIVYREVTRYYYTESSIPWQTYTYIERHAHGTERLRELQSGVNHYHRDYYGSVLVPNFPHAPYQILRFWFQHTLL